MKAANSKATMAVLLLILFFGSCNGPVLYENTKTFTSGWDMDSAAVFDVAVADTSTAMNFVLTFSHTNSYHYCNLWLFAAVEEMETGRVEADTLELYIADTDGRWFGKKSGAIFNVSTYYRHNVKMAKTGNYRFSFRQGMRHSNLEEIKAVAFRVEK